VSGGFQSMKKHGPPPCGMKIVGNLLITKIPIKKFSRAAAPRTNFDRPIRWGASAARTSVRHPQTEAPPLSTLGAGVPTDGSVRHRIRRRKIRLQIEERRAVDAIQADHREFVLVDLK
jgi:hypothetical protein